MYKKTLTYTDYNGVEKTEDFYFNLTMAELAEMQNSINGGLDEVLDKITKSKDQVSIVSYFRQLLLKSYGEKTGDGRFVKNQEVRDRFESTAAYSELFMLFATDDEEASAFINGIIPKEAKASNKEKIVKLPLN